MSGQNPEKPKKSSVLSARRLAMLASVAGLGAFVVIGGPISNGSWGPAWAAEATLQHPASFADIVAKVKPAVISVRVKVNGPSEPEATRQNERDETIPPAPGSPLDKFRRQFGPDEHSQAPQTHKNMIAEGSGFFISADGYAVTNNHVVEHASSVQITTADGTIYKARIVGTDPKTDLALLKIDGKTDFPFVKFADHAPQVGDWVIAVGNPFGFGGTVTAGIVSASARDIGAGPYDDYIQIDAPINKGNSGGPAFDVEGNVIGVNTAIYSPSGGSVGIGFDIPSDTVKTIVAQLKDKGYVTRAWLGVQVQPVTAEIADSLGLKTVAGAIVDSAQPNSPAARAGLKPGDVILAVNGKAVKDARDLARIIAMTVPNSDVKLDVVRQGGPAAITVTLAKMPNEQQASAETQADPAANVMPHLGLTVQPASTVSGFGGPGVVVTGVDPDGPAAEQGFRPGNLILDVNGKPVANARQMANAVREAKVQGKHDVLMRVKAGNAMRFVTLPLDNA